MQNHYEKMEEITLEVENMFEVDGFEEPKEVENPTDTTETDSEVETTDVVDEPKEEEELEEELEKETEGTTDVNTLYTVLKDFIPLEDSDKVDEDFLRDQLNTLPSKLFMNYVDNRPQIVKDLLQYQANLENPTSEQLATFFKDYLQPTEVKHDLETVEGARQYLKSQPQFTKFYKTEDSIEQGLDILEDGGEIIERAKEIYLEGETKKEESKKVELQRVAQEKKEKEDKQLAFNKALQEEVSKLGWDMGRKQKALNQINSSNISDKWSVISTNPKHLIEFGNILDYYSKETGFQALYDVLEGKIKSKENAETKKTIEKDSLGRALNRGNTRTKADVESMFI